MKKIILKPHTDIIIKTVSKYLPNGQDNWVLSGFINPQKEIYTFGNDSKIIGRLFEVLVYPFLEKAANDLNYILGESKNQKFLSGLLFFKT